jgi:hypothetical protein
LRPEFRHLGANAATVNFDLRFTRSTGTHTRTLSTNLTTGLTGHGLTPTTKSRQQVLELSEFDLRLSFTRLCVLGKNVKNHGGSVDYFDLDSVFEGSALAGGQLCISHDGVGAFSANNGSEFFDLSTAKVCSRVRVGLALQKSVENFCARCFTECCELLEGIHGIELVSTGVNTNDDDLFESHLSVFDLRDVLELGTQPVDTSEGRSILEIHLADSWFVEFFVIV